MDDTKFLVFGSTGWIGGLVVDILEANGDTSGAAQSRMEDRAGLIKEIEENGIDVVVGAAGVTGRPNVDWCEDNKPQTVRGNLLGALNVVDVCYMKGVYFANFGSGCIYEYDKAHPIGGTGFTEEEAPNYAGSFYSETKIAAEKVPLMPLLFDPVYLVQSHSTAQFLSAYPNVLQLRLRMPVSGDLHPRSLVTKLLKYERIVNVPNSISVLSDLLPVAVDMMKKRRTGVYNFVNPGVVSHNELLSLYKEHVDPSFQWKNFSLEEQAKILKAGRSNNALDVTKLTSEYPDIPEIHESLGKLFVEMAQKQ